MIFSQEIENHYNQLRYHLVSIIDTEDEIELIDFDQHIADRNIVFDSIDDKELFIYQVIESLHDYFDIWK